MAKPEDNFTNTVADAAAYERWRAQDDYPDEYAWPDYLAGDDLGLPENEDDEDEDRCGCSDPCCPCEGIKRGVP